MHIMKLLDM